MDFIQAIKREHTRANDILDRLAESSEGALKTRERLTSQIGELLDEHARKEEAYLYPALQAHREAHEQASDFLSGAWAAHAEIGRLAAELAGMAKDAEAFVPKVSELKKLAQQHMRDEERLLPALRKALSEEEAHTLDEALSGAREPATERAAERTVTALRHGAETAAEGARHAMESVSEQAGRSGRAMMAAAEIYGETAQLTAEDFQAIATCSNVAAGGMSELRQAWMEWLGRGLRTSARASQELMRCTTIEQLAGVQRNFLKESFENLLEGSAQMLRISSRISEDARRPIEDCAARLRQGGETRSRARRAS